MIVDVTNDFTGWFHLQYVMLFDVSCTVNVGSLIRWVIQLSFKLLR